MDDQDNREYLICYSCMLKLNQQHCRENNLPIKAVHCGSCPNTPECPVYWKKHKCDDIDYHSIIQERIKRLNER